MTRKNGTKARAEQTAPAVEETVPAIAEPEGELIPAQPSRREPLRRAVRVRVQTVEGMTTVRLERPCGHATDMTLRDIADVSFEFFYTLSQRDDGTVQLEEDCHLCRHLAENH